MRPGSTPSALAAVVDGRRAVLDLDQAKIGRMLRQARRGPISRLIRRPGAARSRASGVLRRCSNRKMPCQVPSTGSPVLDRDRQLGLGQRACADARACRRALRRHARSRRLRARSARNRLEIAPGGGRRILLDQQRRRGVAAEHRQQAVANSASQPRIRARLGDFVKSGATRANRQNGAGLAKHGGRLTARSANAPACVETAHLGQSKSARLAASAF